MGGAVSSGESNDDLIDNLLEADYIKSPLVERVFRAVDRAFYYTEAYKQNAYKDLAWKDGNLHLSAPCIYSEVLENLDLQPGMCFLNIGSGTGYFSTMCGLILGNNGVNHGIELYQDVVNYARLKLDEFQRTSSAIDEFDFCLPEFTVGNCLDAIPTSKRYDRIYCGAAASTEYVAVLVDMLKIGGICVVPVGDSLIQITRIEEKKDERKVLLPVSFANLVAPRDNKPRIAIELPEWTPKTLSELCRSEIRKTIRQTINYPEPKCFAEENRKKKRKRRQERRRASRLVVVQRRRSGSDVNCENGFVAIAYSMSSNSSDEDRNQDGDRNEGEQLHDDESRDSGNPVNNEDSGKEDVNDDTDVVMDAQEGAQSQSSNGISHGTSDSTGTNDTGLQGPSPSAVVGNGTSSSNGNGVAVVSGSCAVYSVINGSKKVTEENIRREGARRPERRSASAAVSPRSRVAVAAPRSARNGRNYTTGAESLLGRIRELVRARQQDLESMRRQFQRNSSDTEHSRSRSASGREDSNSDDASNRRTEHVSNGNRTVEPLDTETSSSDSSPPASATSSSSDDEVNAETQKEGGKKRCRNESGEKGSEKEPKPDPLLINPCSVQMRKKIINLPLPPALKVYLNYDRKLYY